MNNLDTIEILLVEDNENDAEMAMRALKENNLTNEMYHVRDGQEALDFIHATGKFSKRNKNKVPKVILLDLKLPKIDGLEVLQELKGNVDTRMIPVIMLTSSSEERDLVESYKLGVNSYIVKPVEFDKFAEAIKGLGFYWLLLNKIPEK